jgi:DNA-binding NarL/FixJ family response regulator
MEKIKVILVDDEKEALNRMGDQLKMFDHVKLLSKEYEPEKALERIIKTKPDLVFLDIEMPRMNGFEMIKKIHEKSVFPTFIIVTAFNQYAIKAIKAEAFDFIIKPIDIDDLRECLERYDKKINSFPHIDNSNLSEREKEVARLVCRGKTSKEIGELLHISKHTVDTHRRNIIAKIGEFPSKH